MTNSPQTQVNAEGNVLKVVQVASDGEQIAAGAIGLITAGPLGALAAWGAIRMFAGKWTPWILTGFIASPVLLVVQIGVFNALPKFDEKNTNNNQSRIELIAPAIHA